MQITLGLPEDIAQGLESKWNDLARAALVNTTYADIWGSLTSRTRQLEYPMLSQVPIRACVYLPENHSRFL